MAFDRRIAKTSTMFLKLSSLLRIIKPRECIREIIL